MTTLKAKVGGVWVPLGVASEPGQNEVAIQADTPASSEVELWYDTDDPGASFPNMPRGYVGHAFGTAAQSGIGAGGTFTDFTGVAVTWTADPSRRYRFTLFCPGLLQQSAVGNQRVGLRNGADQLYVWDILDVATASGYFPHHLTHVVSGLSGTQTVKGSVAVFGGNVNTTAGFLPALVVEDIGAAGVSGGGVWTDSLPKGIVGYAQITANTGTWSTEQEVPGLSVVVPCDVARSYRVTVTYRISTTVAGDRCVAAVQMDGTSIRVDDFIATPGASITTTMIGVVRGPTTGNHTFRSTLGRSGGTGVVGVLANPQAQAFIMVEDIGRAA